jgi:hypothetical protein
MQSRRSSYSYILRAIGQSLEEKRIVDFDLIVVDRNYIVRCRRRSKPVRSKVRNWWQGLWINEPDVGPSISYSPVDIEWLNYNGEGKRQIPDREPDYGNLAQMLRTVGAYIDLRRMRLLELRRRGDQLRLRLEESDGGERVEEHRVVSFHHYFRFLCLRCRSNIPAIEVDFQRRA